MKQIILIDGEPLKYRAAFSAEFKDNVCSGIITYFFDMLEKFQTNEVLLFWDMSKSRWRSEYFPEYKQNRADTKAKLDREEVALQKDKAMKFLANYGVRNIAVPGVEADDFIAIFSEYFSKVYPVYDRIIIATRDHDLWQLINDTVVVYDPLSNTLIDSEVVVQETGLPPDRIPEIKALQGDPSDNIKGVKDIGKVNAVKFLNKYGSIAELLDIDNAKELKKSKRSGNIIRFAEDLEVAYQLTKLPTLYEASYYLSSDEMSNFRQELIKTVNPDTLRVQAETEMLGLSHRVSRKYCSGLDTEIVGILPWLEDKRVRKPSELSQLDSIISSCNRCTLGECGPELPKGYSNADIMVIGRDLYSVSDEFLTGILSELEIDADRVWRTSVCKCLSELPPTYGQVQACSDFIKYEIEFLKPRLIISFGNEAMGLVSPYKSDVVKHCGEILEVDDHYVALLVDPVAVKRSSARAADMEFGIGKLKQFLEEKRNGSN